MLSSSEVALSNTIQFKKYTKYGSLASKARLAQRLPQQNVLSSRKLGLARSFQQKILSKLPGLSESALLSHRYFSKRMSVHLQKMNSLSAVGTLSEFFRKCIYSMNTDELA